VIGVKEIRTRRLALNPPASVSELAEAAGVARPTVMRIESGATPNPGVQTIRAIERGLIEIESRRAR